MPIALVLVMLLPVAAADGPVPRGRALAQQFCASCHATGRDDPSPHVGAPPFRDIGRTVDVDSLPRRLERGLASIHPDMPEFRFTPDDARAFRDYLRTIQQ